MCTVEGRKEGKFSCHSNKQKLFCCPAGSRIKRQKMQRQDFGFAVALRKEEEKEIQRWIGEEEEKEREMTERT